MSALLALLLVALLPAAAAAAPREASRAETLIAGVEASLAETGAPGWCPLAAVPGRLKEDPEFARRLSSGPALGDLLMLHVCRAVAAGSAAPCAALADIPLAPTFGQMPSKAATHTLDRRCLANYYNVLMSRASLARDPDLERLCLENERLHPVFLEGKAAEGCRLVAEEFSAPPVCARVAALLDAGATGCLKSMRQLVGDEAFCPAIPDRMNRELCLGAAAYRRTLARGADACGGDAVCRLMRGRDAGVCRVYEDRLKASVCPALAAGERRRLAAGLARNLDEAEGLLPAADGGGRNDASLVDALGERAARARLALH